MLMTNTSRGDRPVEPFEALHVGMTEAEVLARVGDPDVALTADQAAQHYYISGYTYHRRPIRGKVLIYEPVPGQRGQFLVLCHIVYVYLDRDGRVEEVFIGQD